MFIMLGFIISTILMFIFYGYTDNTTLAIIGGLGSFLVLNALFYKAHVSKKKEIRNVNLNEISNMTGIQFEEYLFTLFKLQGYKVKRTATTGDFGADLILADGNNKVVVQAKRYKSSVGIKAVQEVLGAKSYYGANDAWVVTNSHFTNAAKQLAAKSGISLIDKHGLIDIAFGLGIYLDSYAQATPVEQVQALQQTAPVQMTPAPVSSMPFTTSKSVSNSVTCPLCHSEMVVRNGGNGKFYGCSHFPKCRGTMSV